MIDSKRLTSRDPIGEAARLSHFQEIAEKFVSAYFSSNLYDEAGAWMSSYLSDPEIENIKEQMSGHLSLLFAPELDERAVSSRTLAMARAHVLTGVPFNWMIELIPLVVEVFKKEMEEEASSSDLDLRCAKLEVLLHRQMKFVLDFENQREKSHIAFLHELSQITNKASTPSDLIQEVLKALCQLDGITGAYFGRFNSGEEFKYEYIEGESFELLREFSDNGQLAPVSKLSGTITGLGPAGRAWRSGEIQYSPSIKRDPTMAPWAEACNSFGVRSLAQLPITDIQGDPLALIGIYSCWPGYFGAPSIHRLLELVRQQVSSTWTRLGVPSVLSNETRKIFQGMLGESRIDMVYQPIIDLKTGRVHKLEALARLRDQSEKHLIPDDFLSAFGADDLFELFKLGFSQGTAALAFWREHGIDTEVSFNLTANGFFDSRYLNFISHELDRSGLDPSTITIEFTEGATENDGVGVHNILKGLKGLGVKLSQDDLGSGFSSLKRMEKFGFDEVKIDQMLVRDPSDPRNTIKLMEHLTSLAHDMGIAVVVEGLETEPLLQAAAISGADYGQGFAIARPMPRGYLTTFVRNLQWHSGIERPTTNLGGIAKLRQWARKAELLTGYPEVLNDPRTIGDLRRSLTYLSSPQVVDLLDRLEEALRYGISPQYYRIKSELTKELYVSSANTGGIELIYDAEPYHDADWNSAATALRSLSSNDLYRLAEVQSDLFEIIGYDSNPDEALEKLCLLAEGTIANSAAMVFIADPEGALNLEYAPSLSAAAKASLSVTLPTSTSGAPSNSYLSNQPIYIASNNSDPRAVDIRETMSDLGFVSCWSAPIRGQFDRVLGVFSIASSENKLPNTYQREFLSTITLAAQNAIGRLIEKLTFEKNSLRWANLANPRSVSRFCIDLSNGSLFEVSDEVLEFLGYSKEQASGLVASDISKDLDERAALRLAAELGLDGTSHLVSKFTTSNGDERLVELLIEVCQKDNRRYLDTTIVDISDRSRSEQILASNQMIRDRILNTSAFLTMTLDPTGKTLMVNESVVTMIGSSEGDLLGKEFPFDALLTPKDREAVNGTFVSAGTSRKSQSIDVWITTSDTKRYYLTLRVSPIFDTSGSLLSFVCTAIDMTARYKAQQETEKQKNFVSQIIDALSSIVIVLDEECCIVQCNRALEEFSGFSFDQMRGKRNFHLNFYPPQARPGALKWFQDAMKGVAPARTVTPWVHKSGAIRMFEWRSSNITDQQGKIRFIVGVAADITEDDEKAKELRRAAAVFENSVEGIIIVDKKAMIVDVNEGFSRITGYYKADCVGKNAGFWGSNIHDAKFFEEMYRSLRDDSHWSGTIWNRKKDGEVFPVLMNITAIRDSHGEIDHYVAICSDISEMIRYQKQLAEMAFHDLLTGLANRSFLVEKIRTKMAEARRSGSVIAVAYMDLDNFKPVNDTYGHSEGDRLLIEVARRLEDELREVDTVARIGGDEFVCLLELKDRPECERIVNRIINRIEEPYGIAEGKAAATVSASIGVAFYEYDDTDPDSLLRQADQLMYSAKRTGGMKYMTKDMASTYHNSRVDKIESDGATDLELIREADEDLP